MNGYTDSRKPGANLFPTPHLPGVRNGVDDLGVEFWEWFGPRLREAVAMRDKDVEQHPEEFTDGRWVWCIRYERRPGPPAGTM
jgi:hypothetical protein